MSRVVNATFINGYDGRTFLMPGKKESRACHRTVVHL